MLTSAERDDRQKVEYAKVKRLIPRGERDLQRGFNRLSQKLKSSGEIAEIQFDIVSRTTQSFTVSLGAGASEATKGAARLPDVRVIIARETWQQVAEGALSPLEAYLGGKLRFRGDADLAKRLLRHVVGPGEVDVCR
jgi:SCP-2 sterol transfer family